MTFSSYSPSSPKRSLPAMEASTSESTKKLKVDEEQHNDLTKRIQTLPKKDRKRYHKAKKLGQRTDIVDGTLILHPKIHIRHHNDYLSFNDIRSLILGVLFHDTKLPKGMDIYERHKLTKVVVVDVPILDPSSFDTNKDDDDSVYYHTLSKSVSPAHVYNQWIDPQSPYPAFLEHLEIDMANHDEDDGNGGCDKDNDAFGKVAMGFCDRRKGLMDRFSQILQCKLTKGQVKKLRQQANGDDDLKETAVPAEELVLTRQELINDNYPMHSTLMQSTNDDDNQEEGALLDGWIETPAGRGSDTRKKLLAMDCEMCRSGRRLVLTKVALVDEDHKVLLNEFVMPDCVITDYVTDYSGVDEASLKGVTTTLQDIQQQLLTLIDGDTILVGHGLVNDLRVLKMRHPHIIDTSVIYHHKNGPPYKASLKDLSTMILHRQIQQPQEQQQHTATTPAPPLPVVRGHDPCEDAIASMELVQLKMQKGLKFGLHADYLTELMVDRLDQQGKLGVMIDASDQVYDAVLAKELKDHPRAYRVDTSQAAVALAVEHHAKNDLVLLKLNHPGTVDEQVVMNQVRYLYDHLDPHTALILLAGDYKTDDLDRLRKKWYTYKADLKTRPLDEIPDDERWTELDEQRLDTLVELAKRYYIIPSIKIVK